MMFKPSIKEQICCMLSLRDESWAAWLASMVLNKIIDGKKVCLCSNMVEQSLRPLPYMPVFESLLQLNVGFSKSSLTSYNGLPSCVRGNGRFKAICLIDIFDVFKGRTDEMSLWAGCTSVVWWSLCLVVVRTNTMRSYPAIRVLNGLGTRWVKAEMTAQSRRA